MTARQVQVYVTGGGVKQSGPSFRDGALAPDPESRDSGFDASHRPGMTADRYDFAFSRRDTPEVLKET